MTASPTDAAIIAAGLGVLSWVFLMASHAYDATMSLPERLISISYPLMDVFVLGVRFEIRGLSDLIRSRLLAGCPVEAGYPGTTGLWKALGLVSGSGSVLMLPLLIQEELGGAISITSDSALPEVLKDGFKTLGSQVSLALESVHSQEQVAHQASHNPLTNLPNRCLFMDHLEDALDRTAHSWEPAAALFLDLDNFKNVNDSLVTLRETTCCSSPSANA